MSQSDSVVDMESATLLKVRLFGNIEVSRGGVRLTPFASANAELLFSFLVLNAHRMYNRDTLVEKFLPDEPLCSARKRLRTTIWQIRSALETEGGCDRACLITTNREVGFNAKCEYWLDVSEFESVINTLESNSDKQLSPPNSVKLKKALTMYRGNIWEGEQHDWCVWEKERYRMLHLRGVEMLMKYYASIGSWQQAIEQAELLISEDPLREHVYRHLMRYHYALGDRPAAMVQYDHCRQLLLRELGIEPMRTTKELFRSIEAEKELAGQAVNQNLTVSNKQPVRPESVTEIGLDLEGISNFASQLDELNAKLAHGLELVKQISTHHNSHREL